MRPLLLLTSALAAAPFVRGSATCADGVGDDNARLEPVSWHRIKARGHERHAAMSDRFEKRASGQAYKPFSTQNGQCMDVQNAKLQSGSRVQLWQCSGGANQQWRMEGPSFQTGNDMCLDVPDGNAFNGAPLQVWQCDGQNKNQHWSRLGNTLQWAGAQSYCVDVPDGRFNNGNLLQLWTCYAGSVNQAFNTEQGANKGPAIAGPAPVGATTFYGYNCISLDDFVQKYPECAPYKGALQSAGADEGINPVFLGSIALVESNCNAGITGRNAGNQNAKYGPFQFMYEPAWTLYGGANKDKTNFWDAAYGAARYFSALLDQTNGNLHQAMRNYNGEPANGGDPNYQAHAAAFMGGYG